MLVQFLYGGSNIDSYVGGIAMNFIISKLFYLLIFFIDDVPTSNTKLPATACSNGIPIINNIIDAKYFTIVPNSCFISYSSNFPSLYAFSNHPVTFLNMQTTIAIIAASGIFLIIEYIDSNITFKKSDYKKYFKLYNGQ